MNSYDYHGQENFDNPNSVEARSYTFGEPVELIVEKLIARVERLEAQVEAFTCADCPGAGNGCCKD